MFWVPFKVGMQKLGLETRSFARGLLKQQLPNKLCEKNLLVRSRKVL